MRPVVTPSEMAAIDASAPEPLATLIARAGWATARAAVSLLGSGYGKRILILVGKGNNGADGRAAVSHLERTGARCEVQPVEVRPEPRHRHRYDLLIDAAYGTGLGRPFGPPPSVGHVVDMGVPVLAVDIPSGVDGLTGQVHGSPVTATATVTFGALKPGLLFHPGRGLAGSVTVADIGLDCSKSTIQLSELDDLAAWPTRAATDHKWRRAVAVVGGSASMVGAASLAAEAALRAGSGYVALVTAEGGPSIGPTEAVKHTVGDDWSRWLAESAARFGALVVGPGLAADGLAVGDVWARPRPATVFDAGALRALAQRWGGDEGEPPPPGGPSVLTPHDGEFDRLNGASPGLDRVEAARSLARRWQSVVVLKGPTTVVAAADGRVSLSTAGDSRLATAGTGDVLAGVIGAGLAGGLDPWSAAALGVELHGQASQRGLRTGFVAGDLPALVAQLLDSATNSECKR